MSRILLVEDETVIRHELHRLLARAGYDVQEAGSVSDAVSEHAPLDAFDVILTDVRLPGPSGMELIAASAPASVIVMTSYATVANAVEAMKLGAVDYLPKPFNHDELLLVVERAVAQGRLRRQVKALRADVARTYPVGGIIGRSASMLEVFERVRKVATTDATVLIRGESGTGKELVARAIHERSPRRDAPLVAVNCAAIPEGLVESELFGHEKGAFTGASTAHTGLIEAADGGTFFLDEVGELPAAAQARLLRVLQESEVRRVGATRPRRVNVRVIAATHRDLPRMVKEGAFRTDLYFRLRVFEIFLAPLRERLDDLEDLTRHLLARHEQRFGKVGLEFSVEAWAAIMAHHWPGNVRELDNAIERAMILCDTGRITPELLALDDVSTTGETTRGDLIENGEDVDEGGASLQDYFRRFVLEHQDTLSETELARRLGISRKALWERRLRVGLPRSRNRS